MPSPPPNSPPAINRAATSVHTKDDAPVPFFKRLRRMSTLFQPRDRKGPSFVSSLVALTKASWLNFLLVFIPVAWGLHYGLDDDFKNKDTLVFVFCFIAILPLAKLLAFATEQLSLYFGQTVAGLLNATLGNAVELIVAIVALTKCELRIVQSSLVGSILSNLLLVLGMCFFAGGLKYSQQGFGTSAVQLNSSLLTVSVIAVLLPAAFNLSGDIDDETLRKDILRLSHGVALILLFIYGAYLTFQLWSHADLYHDQSDDIVKSIAYTNKTPEPTQATTSAIIHQGDALQSRTNTATSPTAASATLENGTTHEEEDEKPVMNIRAALFSLGLVTFFVAFTAEFLVDSINGLTETGAISKEFVGLILLPIVGNAAEHVTAVTVSVKDKLMLSLGVAVGSSIQLSLFVIPFVIVLAWIMGKPLTLLFDPYESIALFLAVLIVNYVTQDGKSNWLEGMILMCVYAILGVTFWFYPGSDPSGILATCH
ncbi:calcium/proton exchanger [Pluteus cervinus]|uniref:Calcium/proton exchanger n=1 Tax=Pluteus cervinus TaxID=181527 RepID=A0ACD3B4V0_9AGAR|nr:calcium/proton exchanger [Pluteus cervinus]